MKLPLLIIFIGTLAMDAKAVQLHPDFPIVYGKYQMTSDWAINLPVEFNRRIEDGSLVLWRPGFTIWIDARNNDQNQTVDAQLEWLKTLISKDAFDIQETSDKGVNLLTYRLNESMGDDRVPALHCFAVSSTGYVSLAIYFDKEDDLKAALSIAKGLVHGTAT